MTLPYDIARCVGTTAPLCQMCRRREPARDWLQTYIAAAWTLGSGCPNFIGTPTIYANSTTPNV